MKDIDFLKDLHIGRLIKRKARQREIPSNDIAKAINRYQDNANKIFELEDMYVDDVVEISYLLGCNILEELSEKYLSHLPHIVNFSMQENLCLTLDLKTKNFTIKENAGSSAFLKGINIGEHIKNIALYNRWSENEVAKRLQCSQSNVSDLYRKISIKVKRLFWISEVFGRNVVADVYLSQMFTSALLQKLKFCQISISERQIRITTTQDEAFLLVFDRQGIDK